jgi:putative NADPH-quinone reductase
MNVLIIFAHPNPMSFTRAVRDHIYFHSILEVSPEIRKKYLEIAYIKGKELSY